MQRRLRALAIAAAERPPVRNNYPSGRNRRRASGAARAAPSPSSRRRPAPHIAPAGCPGRTASAGLVGQPADEALVEHRREFAVEDLALLLDRIGLEQHLRAERRSAAPRMCATLMKLPSSPRLYTPRSRRCASAADHVAPFPIAPRRLAELRAHIGAVSEDAGAAATDPGATTCQKQRQHAYLPLGKLLCAVEADRLRTQRMQQLENAVREEKSGSRRYYHKLFRERRNASTLHITSIQSTSKESCQSLWGQDPGLLGGGNCPQRIDQRLVSQRAIA